MAMTLDNLQTHVYIIYGAFGGMYFLLFCVVLYLMVAVARLNKKLKRLNQGGGHSGAGGNYQPQHQGDELRQRGYATYDGNRQGNGYQYPPSSAGPISPPGRMSQQGGSQGNFPYDNRAYEYEQQQQQQQKKSKDQEKNEKMLKMGAKFGGKLAKKGFKEFNEDNDLF